MRKKIIGLLAIGLVFAMIMPIGSAYAAYDCKLSAIGIIRIDKANSVIKGFVFFGDNDGQDLRFTFIQIKFDDARTPLIAQTNIPFLVHEIEYNPTK
ncbi:MAG: hypothetical protein BV458_09475 [Thermoplasmata archaeon M9B2D]|nr:MAG: hypothetical protein BV458_09475 [Thermoplasmata archaeon M9B2D]